MLRDLGNEMICCTVRFYLKKAVVTPILGLDIVSILVTNTFLIGIICNLDMYWNILEIRYSEFIKSLGICGAVIDPPTLL